MNKQTYNWKRFWCPREGSISLDNNGFLYQSEFTKNTFGFEAIAGKSCLILLGEPGIGKSQALTDAVDYASKNSTDEHFYLDLRSYGSEQRLYDALFSSAEIKQWLDGDYLLQLFLDSLDECLLRVDTVAALLVEELKKKGFPVERLVLRISCRTAELPRVLETGLREIYKAEDAEDNFGVYELCPLRPEDVLEAARIEKIDAEAFFKQTVQKNVGMLAARPITFGLLLNLFRKHNQFPDKLTDIYEQGCRLLCDEINDNRRDSPNLRSDLTPARTMLVAARIAAYMILCNKAAVWKDVETGEHNADDILVRELHGGNEELAGISFPVTEEAVRKALATGLFTARGANRLGWAHQTFAEFLAAWYVSRHNLDKAQILSLIIHPSDTNNQIAPQLLEASAWLASLRADVFDELLQTNPISLLRSDVASFSVELRTKLVDELLKIFAAEKASDRGLYSYYRRLKHPALAAQLLPVIKDKNANYLARRFAIDVADACELHDLQNDLADVILDETEPDYVRANAGYALWRVGDAKTKRRIKPYAINGSPNDKDQRVRGVALLCNWDENMSAEEVFASLVRTPHLHDSYSLFLSSHFLPKLKIEDLPVALRWVKENAAQFGHDFSIERVIDEIMLLGWQNLDAPGVLQSFAEAALIRLRLYNHHIIKPSNVFLGEDTTELLAGDDKRRIVLKAIAPLLNEKPHDFFRVFQSSMLRPRKEDLPFLIDSLAESGSVEEQNNLAEIITEFYRFVPIEPDVLGFLYDGYNRSENVRKLFPHIFEPVELHSENAFKMKSEYENWLKQQKEFEEMSRRHQSPPLDPSPKERVLNILERIENGEKMFFWLTQELSLEPDSEFYRNDWEADATEFQGWAEADTQTQERIVEAAKDWVLHGDPENDEWVGTNSFQYSALGGFRALILLSKVAPEFVQNLDNQIWGKWAAIIVLHPSYRDDEKDAEPHYSLIAETYKRAPNEIIATVLKVISAANENGEHLFFDRKWSVLWDEKFKTALREKLGDSALKPGIWGRILEELLEHGDAPTQEIAQMTLISFVAGKAETERALHAGASLMRHAQGADWWSYVWKALEKDAGFGRALTESVCFHTRPSNKLNENAAAEFYLWLVKMFPPGEDPPIPMGQTFGVSKRMEITTWRDSFLTDLNQRGTPESLHALETIAAASLEFEERLHWILIEARENVRRHTWQPPTPTELLDLLKQKTPEINLGGTTSLTMKTPLTDEEIDRLSWNGETVSDIPALSDFLKIYRERLDDIVFFVGAGLSRPLFPGWETALSELLTLVSKRFNYPKKKEAAIRKMLNAGNFLDVADACARDLGENNYRAFIEQQFDKDFALADVPQAYAALLDLKPQTILTTNYDRIPEVGGQGKYLIFTNTDIGEAESAIQKNRLSVFKLHGSVTQQSSIILTRAEYQNIYQNDAFKDFIKAVFKLKIVIFLGFGLADSYFNFVLENIYAGNRRILQGKYALLEGLSSVEIQSKERGYGLNIIPYQKSADSHPEVLAFIHLLSKVRG